MTREHKLALILGFSVVLVVGVLISDHFSDATVATLEDLTVETIPVADARPVALPLEQTHASAAPASNTLPGGFSLDGEPQAGTSGAIANRSVFTSGREALLNELQDAWDKAQTMSPVPAVELDTIETQPESMLPEPTIVAQAPAPRMGRANSDIATKTHRVMEDESLWSIAQEHYGDGALYTKLIAFNRDRVGEDDSIHVGVVLRIPTRQALTGERHAERKKTTASRPASTSSSAYTVRAGDTLGEIAQKMLGSSKRWTEIVDLNDIEDPDVVPVGTTLKMPASSR